MYYPGRETALTIRQLFGFGTGRLMDVVEQYRTQSPEPHNDQDLLRYCRSITHRPLGLPILPDQWNPSDQRVDNIPLRILTSEYLPLFLTINAGRPVRNGDFNDLYREFCRMRWSVDSRNEDAVSATFMTMEWIPDKEQFDNLKLLFEESWQYILGEFRLYWKESGAYRSDWNAIFSDHLQRMPSC